MCDGLEISLRRKVKVKTTNKKLKRFCLNYLETSNKLLIICEHVLKVHPEAFTLLWAHLFLTTNEEPPTI